MTRSRLLSRIWDAGYHSQCSGGLRFPRLGSTMVNLRQLVFAASFLLTTDPHAFSNLSPRTRVPPARK